MVLSEDDCEDQLGFQESVSQGKCEGSLTLAACEKDLKVFFDQTLKVNQCFRPAG